MGTNPINTIRFMCLILKASKKLIASKLRLILLQFKMNVWIQFSNICSLFHYLLLSTYKMFPLIKSWWLYLIVKFQFQWFSSMLLTEVTLLISANQIFTTLAGEFQTNRLVLLQDIVLPEFKHAANYKSCLPIIYWSILVWYYSRTRFLTKNAFSN